ncbi:hypothetical protein K6119_02240 [Paracrocinitomix mangrovi]|uniref:DUF6134 family protein n=1 Tax=Paracrocinitomix mangrovi TaxID=2862509 RepID=UPI001C8D4B05|nr:DUF6134 family protein [Paracrocinitomix mangrovi]UKN02339.1 hypothetical protein K6119_02240 [Paracrocinitomix mangrovi]
MKGLFLVFLTFVVIQSGYAKTSEYTILSKENEYLGTLKVNSSKQDGIEEIYVESEITIKKIFTVMVSYTLQSKFKGKKLLSNEITTYMNKKVHEKMSTFKKESKYIFTKNTKQKDVKDFNFCESMMYFNEPIGVSTLYSEFDGVFKPTSYIAKDSCYALTNPINKNVSKYYYKDGILRKAIVKSALATLYLYLKLDK